MRYKQIFKPLQKVISASLICASFTACSNSETDDISLSTEQNRVPLSVSAIIQSGDNSRKASLDAETFEVGDTIGLFILGSYNSAYNESTDSYNLPAVFNGTDFDLTQDIYLADSTAYVYAYYPYSSSYGKHYPSYPLVGVEMDLSTLDNDVLYTTEASTATRDNPEATISFSHALARVTLSVKVSEESEEATLTSANLYSTFYEIATNAYLYFSDSALAFLNNNLTNEASIDCEATLSSTQSTDIDILIYPTTAERITASLVIDDTTYEFEFPTSLTDTWEAGCQYTYPITLTISSATEDDSTGDGTTDYNGYEAVDLGLSVKWATMNLGADSPEDYGNYYAWGETSKKSSYSTSATFNVSMNDFSGDETYDAATANWGGSWRMPTSTEIKELIDNCTWTWTTQNSVNGYIVTGTNGNSIFFPASGYRSGSKSYYGGSNGYYWSSTPRGGYYNYDAYNLYFSSGGGYYREYTTRSFGLTVRPVID